MKICYFGIYNPNFGRNKIYISGLKKNGVEVIECFDHAKGLAKYWNLIKKHRSIKDSYDVMIVGYPGYTVVWLAKLLTKKPIIFDALCTHYEAQVLSRGIYPLFSINRLLTWIFDHSSVALADKVLVETESQKKFFEKHFHISPANRSAEKIQVLLTGADDSVFYPSSAPKRDKFTVLFRGRFLSEAGLKYIIEAATILENQDVDFLIIGSGHVEREVSEAIEKYNPANLTINDKHLSFDELRNLMNECHVSLGQFANHVRLERTIPHKAFESLAMKLPYITAKAKGHEGFLVDGQNCLLVEPANAKDLAEKILQLKNNPELASRISANGYKTYKEKASNLVLGLKLVNICKSIEEIDKKDFLRIYKFAVTGVTATLTDLILLYIFTDVFHFWYVISVAVAYIIATAISFILQKFWTFEEKETANIRKQGTIFFIVAAISWAVNTYTVFALVEYANIYYLLAQIIVSAFIAVSNYIIYKKFIFKTA